MSGKSLYVVFGAAVKPDGSPSGSLSRRTLGAWALARDDPGSHLFLSGGQGRYGDPEALVMRTLLRDAGASDDRLIIDDDSSDTMDTVVRCAEYLADEPGFDPIYVCSSPYHNPRCWVLLRLFGVHARIPPMPSDRPSLGLPKWLYYWVRECAALPWDVLLALLDRRRGTIVQRNKQRTRVG